MRDKPRVSPSHDSPIASDPRDGWHWDSSRMARRRISRGPAALVRRAGAHCNGHSLRRAKADGRRAVSDSYYYVLLRTAVPH